jgi:drug/metabolite transporter superfamily protein YnfA
MTNTLLDFFCAALMAGDGGWMIWNILVDNNFASESEHISSTLAIVIIFLLFSAM